MAFNAVVHICSHLKSDPAASQRAVSLPRFFAPACKNGFVRVTNLTRLTPQKLLLESKKRNSAKVRRRGFTDGKSPDLVIQVNDPGPGQLNCNTFISNHPKDSRVMTTVAKRLNKHSRRGAGSFVISVMYSAKDKTYYCLGDAKYTEAISLSI